MSKFDLRWRSVCKCQIWPWKVKFSSIFVFISIFESSVFGSAMQCNALQTMQTRQCKQTPHTAFVRVWRLIALTYRVRRGVTVWRRAVLCCSCGLLCTDTASDWDGPAAGGRGQLQKWNSHYRCNCAGTTAWWLCGERQTHLGTGQPKGLPGDEAGGMEVLTSY